MSEKRDKKIRRSLSPALETAGGELTIAPLDLLDRLQFQLPPLFKKCFASILQAWKWAQDRTKTQKRRRKLRVCESAQLGEKRFVALVQADGQRFLIGGTSNSISLLATLPKRQSFRSLLPEDVCAEAIER